MYEYTNQLKNDNYNIVKGKCEDIFCFDIETSSGWTDDKKNLYHYKNENVYSDDFLNSLIPTSIPYLWQFSKNNITYYGREFKDFLKVLNDLPDVPLIIYVHNFAYEFSFLLSIIEFDSVFARQPRHPIYARYKKIEFRCMYMLTRLSLDNVGKFVGFPKLHTLDYDVIRTPKTILTKEELEYGERDVQVMYVYLSKMVGIYGSIFKIPYTQTGKVRRNVKNKLFKVKGYTTFIKKLLPKNVEEYTLLLQCFMGGYVHSNYTLTNIVINNVGSFDFASSYPFVMCAKKYPMTPFYYKPFSVDLIDEYAFILKVTFKKIHTKMENTYLSKSKCINIIGGRYDNGRVMYADELTVVITEQDYLNIKDSYKIESEEILISKASRKGYLPKTYIEYILELYGNKTTLKGVEGYEEFYMKSKEELNSLYGMMVTALLPDEIVFENNAWNKKVKTENDINNALEDLRKNKKGGVFLSFAWGVWVTAYARRRIWKTVEKYDSDTVYVDTDSNKCLEPENKDFTEINAEGITELKEMCNYYNIDFNLCKPKDKEGNEHLLGEFCYEGTYTEFKTLGSKRYIYRDKKDNELHMTVSGVNKGAITIFDNDINKFADGFKFYRDYKDLTIKLSQFIDKDDKVLGVTWNKGKYDSYINTYINNGTLLRRKSYNMTLTQQYLDLLDGGTPGNEFFNEIEGV